MFVPAGESPVAFSASESIGQEIQTILTHREDVLHSFSPGPDNTLDLTDLQAPYISHLCAQREALLRTFRIQNSHEILRNPDVFFQTIVAEFQEQHKARLVWGRAQEIVRTYRAPDEPRTFAEPAHVVEFEQKPGGLQPTLWTSVVHSNREPAVFYARTRLHHAEDWEYVFRSSPQGLEVYREGYERGRTRMIQVEDPLDRATLLQALGVEMLGTITDMHQYEPTVQAINHEAARRRTHEIVHHRSV
jgi:hypothetical protein